MVNLIISKKMKMTKSKTNCVLVPVETMNWITDFIDCIKDCGKIERFAAQLIIDKLNREVKLYFPQESSDLEDGIYLCYEDGYKKPFPTAEETTTHGQVTHIGIKVGKHKVGLKLNSLGEYRLSNKINIDRSYGFDYKKQELHALDDYDGKANTDHLKLNGEFVFDLDDNEWIPALGELAIIFKYKDKLNEALAFVGGDKLTNGIYWSSTEVNANLAWYVGLSTGGVSRYSKITAFAVRPVCAF